MTGLERRTYKFALALQKKKDHPAAVIGAGKSYFKNVNRSGPISPHLISSKLRIKLLTIGEMYAPVNGNFLGCCAEVNAANRVLHKLPHLKLYEIDFANARRPRTMQIIPPCLNCKITFSL